MDDKNGPSPQKLDYERAQPFRRPMRSRSRITLEAAVLLPLGAWLGLKAMRQLYFEDNGQGILALCISVFVLTIGAIDLAQLRIRRRA